MGIISMLGMQPNIDNLTQQHGSFNPAMVIRKLTINQGYCVQGWNE